MTDKKTRPTLLPWAALQAVADVMTVGAETHGDGGWRLAPARKYEDALLRHVMAFAAGEREDADAGSATLAHIAANALILLELADEAHVVPRDIPIAFVPTQPQPPSKARVKRR